MHRKKLVYPVDLDTDVSLLSVDLNVTSDDPKGTSDYTQAIFRRETYKRSSRMRFLSLRNWYWIIKTRHNLFQAKNKELKNTHRLVFRSLSSVATGSKNQLTQSTCATCGRSRILAWRYFLSQTAQLSRMGE